METITLKIKNSDKFHYLLEYIQQLEYVEVVKDKPTLQPKKEASKDDFFAAAGIWEGKDIDAKTLREKAWPKRR